ncbi:MAG TPA: LptA/OstA family protein [Spirochaetota bacterium]|nr:LptA/OstA family protein [Spirochaetota bacterium]
MNLRTDKLIIFFLLLYFSRLDGRVHFSGNKLKYLHKDRAVNLIGRAVLKNNNNRLTAAKMTVYRAKKYAVARGGVRFRNSKRRTSYAGSYINYDYDNEIVTALGGAAIKNKEEMINVYADKITGYIISEKAYAYTNVKVKVYNENKAVIYGNRGIYKKKEGLFIMYGDVWLTNYNNGSTNIISGECVRYHTSETNETTYKCLTNVIIYTTDDENRIYGQKVIHYPDRRVTYITGSPRLENTNDNITLSAGWFERYDDENKMLAKKKVLVETAEYTAHAAWGTYDIDKQTAYLRGNPFVESTENIFYSEEIIFDMQKEKIQMRRQINGSLKENSRDLTRTVNN